MIWGVLGQAFKVALGSRLGPGIFLALAVVAGVLVYGHAQYGAGYDAGERQAGAEAEATTDRAISEQASEADRARFLRRVCRARGGMWSFANNECIPR